MSTSSKKVLKDLDELARRLAERAFEQRGRLPRPSLLEDIPFTGPGPYYIELVTNERRPPNTRRSLRRP